MPEILYPDTKLSSLTSTSPPPPPVILEAVDLGGGGTGRSADNRARSSALSSLASSGDRYFLTPENSEAGTCGLLRGSISWSIPGTRWRGKNNRSRPWLLNRYLIATGPASQTSWWI